VTVQGVWLEDSRAGPAEEERMAPSTKRGPILGGLGLLLGLCGAAAAEEGMWTFDNPPRALLQERYGFSPDAAWLERVRLASVRFNDGGSGAFVSPHGLLLTNHHVAVGQLQKMSSAEQDYVQGGFYARELADEIKAVDLELNVLQSMDDVTARVQAVVKPGMSAQAALEARKAERARLEKESQAATGLRSEIVDLYHGGEYWLYRFKRYTDVRLVWAPEKQAAYFGGDPDNFTYPRHDLDVALFRVYAGDAPLATPHFLKVNPEGAGAGELVFISGHPGGTDRLLTLSQLELLRQGKYPFMLGYLTRALGVLREFAARGPEQARQAAVLTYSYENALKAYAGQFQGLQDPQVMAVKRAQEQSLRAGVAANPEWSRLYGDAWERIERVAQRHAAEITRRDALELWRARLLPKLVSRVLSLVLYTAEIQKPDAERLDGYHDAELEELEFISLSPAPVYKDLEAALLALGFHVLLEKLDAQAPLRRLVSGAGGPEAAARAWLEGTRLDDPAARRALWVGGRAAVEASTDPLVVFARQLEPILRENDAWMKKNVESELTPASERVARARFAVLGKSSYPDATFTLRLTFGPVQGYPMNGSQAAPFTTLHGLYDRSLGFDRRPPWDLPARFWDRRARLALDTRVNFVCQCDIIGGNSGSPVLNRAAELVGVVFDGNIESLPGRFLFDPRANRAVAVHAGYLLHALEELYDAGELADELMGRK